MIKEYNNSTWQGKAYSKIVDTTQQVTAFPTVVRPMENTIPSWTIKGNMNQTGTPTPSSPIQPSECGERTANLFDAETAYGVLYNNGVISGELSALAAIKNSFSAELIGQQVTISVTVNAIQSNRAYIRCSIDGSNIDSNAITQGNTGTLTVTITPTSTSDKWWFTYGSGTGSNTFSNLMLNTGSTALPYQPYGYKLDIKSGNTTTPVYLGEVQSTRRIKKYEFTGNETFTSVTESTIESGSYCFAMFYTNIGMEDIIDYNADMRNIDYPHYTCSHFTMKPAPSSRPNAFTDIIAGQIGANTIKEGTTYQDATYNRYLIFCMSGISTVADFKAYLAAQYAAGTPVTIWYVLATPETAVVNEPIRKIGTYSDSVSGTNLSVIAQSPTTIDVDTSLKPSEMDLTYTGTKMCKRKKRVNGAWV